ncbi:MAG: hypothetical protein OFPII_14560 [Osedax symbiont Rs1]|nr:MAG: hypothetical protein OFPII_14560 [Osedax symbiont Rs1]
MAGIARRTWYQQANMGLFNLLCVDNQMLIRNARQASCR